MKRTIFVFAYLLASINIFGQTTKKYSTYYYQRASLFEQLPVYSDDILFIGNSITDGCEWNELFQNTHIKNRGISGDTTEGVYDRISTLLNGTPAQIFLMIGTNNIPRGVSPDSITFGIRRIVKKIKKESPSTQIFVQSILPVNPKFGMFQGHTSRWEMIPLLNQCIRHMAQEEQIEYIDLFCHFADDKGMMKEIYTNDGLHLTGKGYLLWKEILTPYIKK